MLMIMFVVVISPLVMNLFIDDLMLMIILCRVDDNSILMI